MSQDVFEFAARAIGAIAMTWLVVRIFRLAVRRRASFTPDVKCVNCEYIIYPNSSLHCPECGNNLRESGIVGKGLMRPTYPSVLSVISGLFCASIGIFAGEALGPRFPLVSSYLATGVVPTRIPSTTPGDREAYIEIGVHGNRFLNVNGPVKTLSVAWWRFEKGERRWILDMYVKDFEQQQQFVSTFPATVARRITLDSSFPVEFVRLAGVDVNSERGQAIAAQLRTTLDDLLNRRFTNEDRDALPIKVDSFAVQPGNFSKVVYGVATWLALWWVCIRLLRWWHARRVAAYLARCRKVLDSMRIPAE